MPLTFSDAPIAKKYVLGNKGRVYDEKWEGEELEEDEALEDEDADEGRLLLNS